MLVWQICYYQFNFQLIHRTGMQYAPYGGHICLMLHTHPTPAIVKSLNHSETTLCLNALPWCYTQRCFIPSWPHPTWMASGMEATLNASFYLSSSTPIKCPQTSPIARNTSHFHKCRATLGLWLIETLKIPSQATPTWQPQLEMYQFTSERQHPQNIFAFT